jgi:hypothetical protein
MMTVVGTKVASGQIITNREGLLNLVKNHLKENYALALEFFTKIRMDKFNILLLIDRSKLRCIQASHKNEEEETFYTGEEAVALFQELLDKGVSLLVDVYGINEAKLSQLLVSNEDVCVKSPKLTLHELFKAPPDFVFFEEKKILELSAPPQYQRTLEFRLRALIQEFIQAVPSLTKFVFTMRPVSGATYEVEATAIVQTKELEYPRRVLTYLFEKHILNEFYSKNVQIAIKKLSVKATVLGLSIEHIVGREKEITKSSEATNMIKEIVGEEEKKKPEKPVSTSPQKQAPPEPPKPEKPKPQVDLIPIQEDKTAVVNNEKLRQILSKKSQLEAEVDRILKKAGIDELKALTEHKQKEISNRAKSIAPQIANAVRDVIRNYFDGQDVSLQWSKVEWDVQDGTVLLDISFAVKSEESIGFFGVGLEAIDEETLKGELKKEIIKALTTLKSTYNIPIAIRKFEAHV